MCWIPFFGPVLALVGLVLGIVAWATAGKKGRPKGVAIAATIVGTVAMLGAIVFSIFWIVFSDTIVDCSDPSLTRAEQDQCIEDRVNDQFGVDTQ
jgi:hypothetical protein